MCVRALGALSSRSEDCREAFGSPGEGEDGDPTHTQNLESRSHRPRAWCVCVCLGVGGVPHQLYGGGRVRVPDFVTRRKTSSHTLKCEAGC